MLRENLHAISEKHKDIAVLAGVVLPRAIAPKKYSAALEELEKLADTAGVNVRGKLTQARLKAHLKTYFGKGKVKELKAMAEELNANLVVCDDDLSPAQSKTLEKLLELRVIDRTELILDIFASHAKTREAKLQVELAQLKYSLPRLKRLWVHLDRYKGGIGTKGPGEKQLESDKRLIKKRIRDLSQTLKDIQSRKEMEVKARNDKFITIGLVGYTNAGKSTLMNLLTNAGVMVADKLFATLDTRTRMWEIAKARKVLLSDTVGFIKKLPHHLVASFKATLEEAAQADLLLHVADASHPDVHIHIETVGKVLKNMGLNEKPTLLVLNKIDLVKDKPDLYHTASFSPDHVCISAKQGIAIERLHEKVEQMLNAGMIDVRVGLSVSQGRLLSWIEANGLILEKSAHDTQVNYLLRLSAPHANWLLQQQSITKLS